MTSPANALEREAIARIIYTAQGNEENDPWDAAVARRHSLGLDPAHTQTQLACLKAADAILALRPSPDLAGGGDKGVVEADNDALPFEVGCRVRPRGGGVEGTLAMFNGPGTGAIIHWDKGPETSKALRNLEVIAPALPQPEPDRQGAWVLVPREPTEAMTAAAWTAPISWRAMCEGGSTLDLIDLYRAMIAAAPTTTGGGEDGREAAD